MLGFCSSARRLGVAILAVVIVAAAAPRPVWAQDVPSYAAPPAISTDETIHGRIRSVDGAFTIAVDDDRGFVDSIQLHPGTIINPTGLTLAAGMSVTIVGTNAGSVFSANEIDTPYSYDGPLPTPVYYGAGYWYPGFDYGYGPSFDLAIVFGGGGFGSWHFDHHPFAGRPWNGHAYFGGYVDHDANVEHGGATRRPGDTTFVHEDAGGRAGADAAHVPSAFAGRSFAGESRAPHNDSASSYSNESGARVFSSMATGRGETGYSVSGGGYERRSSPGGGYERGSIASGGYERGSVPSAYPRTAPATGFAHGEPRGGRVSGGDHGSGGGRSFGGGSGHGGGHPH